MGEKIKREEERKKTAGRGKDVKGLRCEIANKSESVRVRIYAHICWPSMELNVNQFWMVFSYSKLLFIILSALGIAFVVVAGARRVISSCPVLFCKYHFVPY